MNDHDLKEQICDVCQQMWRQGWVAANDGNVSARAENGTFWVTPTGMSKRLVTPEKLVRIDANLRVLEGNLRPSSEMRMHLRCYREREDVGAVVHAHPVTATGFAVAGKPLDEYSMIETVLMIGAVPIAPYATPSTDEVSDSIAPYLAHHDVLLLESHGALSVGCDLATALNRMETLEHFAKITLVAHLLGGAKEISPENIERLLQLRQDTYHISGRHPGYQKPSQDQP